jgi:hypothetical protein
MQNDMINEYSANQEAKGIAAEIFKEEAQGWDPEDTKEADNHHDDLRELVDQYIDGHQWVIYNRMAAAFCANCDTELGEEFLEDIGMPDAPTFWGLASTITYGELHGRTMRELNYLIAEWEAQTYVG